MEVESLLYWTTQSRTEERQSGRRVSLMEEDRMSRMMSLIFQKEMKGRGLVEDRWRVRVRLGLRSVCFSRTLLKTGTENANKKVILTNNLSCVVLKRNNRFTNSE